MSNFSIESALCHRVTNLLADRAVGEPLPDSPQLRDFLVHLEYFLVRLLRESYRDWKYESLDGILPALARTLGDGGVEVFALAIIISDQILAPLHVRLQLASHGQEIQWLECRLEEQGPDGKPVRTPYEYPGRLQKRLLRIAEGAGFTHLTWRHHFMLGERN